MLTTRAKIAIAAGLQQVVTALPRLAGRGSETVVRRSGVRWSLDLNEGIDFSIWLLGAFERRTVAAYSRLVKPGMTVLDIGANMGAHTLFLARLVGETGRVIAVEPTAWAVEKLQRNLALNKRIAAVLDVRQVMLVEKVNDALPGEIYASWPLNGHEVHPKLRARAKTTAGAQAMTLDQLAKIESVERVDFIKLDVDGHEGAVLRGGAELLRRDHPTIIFELSPYILAETGDSARNIALLLHDLGYGFYDLNLRPISGLHPGSIEKSVADGASVNVVAIPKA